MSVLRVKYRSAPVQPQLNDPTEASFIPKKKEKPVEEDPYADVKKYSHEDPVFLPQHTQIKRVETVIVSDEEAYRRNHFPTIYERVDMQREWAKEQLKDAKLASEREALKRQMEETLRKERLAAIEGALGLAGESKDGESYTSADGSEIPIEKDELDEEDDALNNQVVDVNDAGYAEELKNIKERKLLSSRNTTMYHKESTVYENRKLALRTMFGYIKKEKDLTPVLPWLLIGRKEMSANLQSLLRLGVTHILNVTDDVPISFPNHFLYEKIKVKDHIDSDIGQHFETAINFIKRAEDCQGRILVHCTAGASRAPTCVMAYLVACKHVPLVDAFNYLSAIRPQVLPNKKFLYQLAVMETELGHGCSVFYHKEWRFYEFNVFRGQGLEIRRGIGLYRTVMLLNTKQRDEEDLLS